VLTLLWQCGEVTVNKNDIKVDNEKVENTFSKKKTASKRQLKIEKRKKKQREALLRWIRFGY
jgi:hypothetical protein